MPLTYDVNLEPFPPRIEIDTLLEVYPAIITPTIYVPHREKGCRYLTRHWSYLQASRVRKSTVDPRSPRLYPSTHPLRNLKCHRMNRVMATRSLLGVQPL